MKRRDEIEITDAMRTAGAMEIMASGVVELSQEQTKDLAERMFQAMLSARDIHVPIETIC